MCPCTMPPADAVSAADWLTLVEKFGLAAYLEGTAKQGGLEATSQFKTAPTSPR
jgi:hypothetical protein